MHQTVEIAVAAIGSPKTSSNCAIGPIGRLVVMIVLFVSYLQPIIWNNRCVASTFHTHHPVLWPGFTTSDFLWFEGSISEWKTLGIICPTVRHWRRRNWIQQAADELMKATVIDLQECLLRRHLLASKKSQILFIHQLDNWWVPASIQCWSLGKRKNDSKQWIAFLYNFGTTKQDKSVESVSASLVRSSWA